MLEKNPISIFTFLNTFVYCKRTKRNSWLVFKCPEYRLKKINKIKTVTFKCMTANGPEKMNSRLLVKTTSSAT